MKHKVNKKRGEIDEKPTLKPLDEIEEFEPEICTYTFVRSLLSLVCGLHFNVGSSFSAGCERVLTSILCKPI